MFLSLPINGPSSSIIAHPPSSPLSPYTTLFRSRGDQAPPGGRRDDRRPPRAPARGRAAHPAPSRADRKSTRLNSSHTVISYAVFCLKKKKIINQLIRTVMMGVECISLNTDAEAL